MSFNSFTSFLPGNSPNNRSTTNMDRFNLNHKRPAPAYRDFDAAKRHQAARASTNEESMFLTDDEGDALGDDDILGVQDNDDDLDFLALSARLAPAQQPAQNSQTRRPANSQSKPAAQSSPSNNINNTTSRTQRPTNGAASTTTSTRPTTTRLNGIPADRSTTTNTNNTTTTTKPIEIKDDPDTHPPEPPWLHSLPSTQRVKVYIGRKNRQVWVRRADLGKSPVLESWVIDDASQGPYIMRPQLMGASFGDMDAVFQFVHGGEYAPLLIEEGAGGVGQGNGEGVRKVWDGVKSSEGYAKELVRAGRIYVLGQMYQVGGLPELVYKKISGVDSSRFSMRAVVELAGVIFGNDRVGTGAGQVNGAASTNVNTNTSTITNGTTANGTSAGTPAQPLTAASSNDPLETWIINQIAENFQEIMKSQQAKFWEIERKTNRGLFYARVLEEVAERYRVSGGKLPEAVVELD